MVVCQKDKNHQHFAGKACVACARQAQLQQVATTQKQNQTQREQVRQKRVQNANIRQAPIQTTPAKPIQPPAIFIAVKNAINQVPKVILHTAIAMIVPVILGVLLMNFIPQGASSSLGSSWIADLIKADYIEQILITMLSVMFLMVSAIILLVIFVFPSMHILKRKP